jgi:alpha-L-fucosidase
MNAFELYLDGNLIAQTNNIHERSYQSATVRLEAGRRYALRLDYHKFVQDAEIHLVWASPKPPVSSRRRSTPPAPPMRS